MRATIRPGLQRAAVAALGDRLGGVAVLRPRDGAVLALAGLAVSAPQPPGSTFKLVTLAAALQAGIVKPTSTYPVRTSATLSGVRLRNAGDEACGGSLTHALTVSCNAVFAPIGARLGAKRLAQAAQRFGFNQVPRVPSAVASRFPAARELRDSLAVGAAAIGQDRDLATPLQMAAVAATIANRGMHAAPRIAASEKVVRRRAVSARVASQVREMMRSVVRSGTGTAAALPGVDVAGKTGTAELRPTADAKPDPKNTDAWFVAFAPAAKPRVAVAVMLVGAGGAGSRRRRSPARCCRRRSESARCDQATAIVSISSGSSITSSWPGNSMSARSSSASIRWDGWPAPFWSNRTASATNTSTTSRSSSGSVHRKFGRGTPLPTGALTRS